MLNIAILGSGRGSNFVAIERAIKEGRLPDTTIVLVISSSAGAGILERARELGIPARHISRKQFDSDDGFVTAMVEALSEHGATFIALAGYMKRLPSQIVQSFRNRIVNIHPALLPRFGGKGMYGIRVSPVANAYLKETPAPAPSK